MALTRPRAAQIYDIDYKQATRVVTVSDITLAGGAPSAVDGVNLSAKDRVLVTGQNTASQNGIYYVATVGSGTDGTWVRSTDTDSTGELLSGTIVMVTEGVIFADTQWKLTTDDPIVIGTTPLVFVQNYSANSISAGSSNVSVTSNANVTISSAGTANVLTISSAGILVEGTSSVTGNIVGNYFIGNGSQLTGVTATSIGVLPSLSVSGNIISGNISTIGQLSVGLIDSNLIPTSNVTYSLGNNTNRWSNIWLANSTIYLGDVILSATDTVLTVNGSNVLTGNAGSQFSTSGNVVGGNIETGGTVSATGNITGSYIIGNGSQLTGLPESYSNANVTTLLSAFGSNTISTSGNITAGYFVGNGSALTTLNGANVTGTVANATYAISAGSATTATTAGTVTTNAQPNITSVGTLSSLSVTGNIVGNYILGNGSQLTGLPAAYSNTNVSSFLAAFGSNSISTSGTIIAGNITGGNLLTSGLISSTGNATVGNISATNYTGTNVSVTGTQTAASTVGGVITGSSASVTGTLTGASLAGTIITASQPNITTIGTLGSLSVTANVQAGNLRTSGLVSATGSITGASVVGGVITGTSLSVSGTQTAASTVGGVITGTSTSVSGGVTAASVSGGVITGTSTSVSGNITGGNLNTGGNVSGSWMLPTAGLSTGGNVLVGGYISCVGNLYVANIVSSQQLVVDDPLVYFTANVTYPYNYAIGFYSAFVGGTGNTYQHTGFVRDYTDNTWKLVSNIPEPAGSAFDFDNAIYDQFKSGNVISTGSMSASGNITGSTILGTTGTITPNTSGVGTGFNVVNGDLTVYRTGGLGGVVYLNQAGGAYLYYDGANYQLPNGNILSGGISVSGGVTAASVSGGVITGTSLSTTGNITTAGTANISTGNILGTIATASQTNITSVGTLGSLSVTANVQAGNLRTAGLVSVTGGVTAASVSGGVITGSSVSVTGTQTAASTVGGVITGSSVSVTGTQTAASTVGGVITGTTVSATGNISGNYLIGNGSQLTGLPASGLKWTTVANTAPSSPSPGDFWYNSYTGIKYQYTNDGTSNVWVDQSAPTNFSTITVSNIVNGNSNGVGNIGSAGGYFNTVFAKATSAQYADLAEMYSADNNYSPGTVVEFGGTHEVTISTESHSPKVAGIVSTNPSYLMNSALDCTNPLEIALTGRVPCRVIGTIRKGDRLVASKLPGVAMVLDMKYYQPGCIIGKALENYDSDAIGVIEVAVGRD